MGFKYNLRKPIHFVFFIQDEPESYTLLQFISVKKLIEFRLKLETILNNVQQELYNIIIWQNQSKQILMVLTKLYIGSYTKTTDFFWQSIKSVILLRIRHMKLLTPTLALNINTQPKTSIKFILNWLILVFIHKKEQK